jgi:hypothetical protein
MSQGNILNNDSKDELNQNKKYKSKILITPIIIVFNQKKK